MPKQTEIVIVLWNGAVDSVKDVDGPAVPIKVTILDYYSGADETRENVFTDDVGTYEKHEYEFGK